MTEPILAGLTPPQAGGLACCWCGAETGPQIPVGHSETGGQVFACAGRCRGLVFAFVGFRAAGLFVTVAELRAEVERRHAERRRAAVLAVRIRHARRLMLLVLLLGAVILLAIMAGALDRPGPAPTDPGAPPAVTTIGGAR